MSVMWADPGLNDMGGGANKGGGATGVWGCLGGTCSF